MLSAFFLFHVLYFFSIIFDRQIEMSSVVFSTSSDIWQKKIPLVFDRVKQGPEGTGSIGLFFAYLCPVCRQERYGFRWQSSCFSLRFRATPRNAGTRRYTCIIWYRTGIRSIFPIHSIIIISIPCFIFFFNYFRQAD